MAMTAFRLCVLLPAVASALEAFSAARSTAGLTGAFQTLDKNNDGRVTFDEVALFAKAKGLDYAATLAEFSGFDANHDGLLDAAELTKVMGKPTPAAREPKTKPAYLGLVQGAEESPKGPALGLAGGTQQDTVQFAEGSQLELSPQKESVEAGSASAAVERRAASLSEYANMMEAEARKEAEAQELDRRATLLRANATAMLRRAQQAASEQSLQAARTKAEELYKSLVSVQNDAMRAEVRAAAIKAKGEAELQEANDLMYVAQAALAKVPTDTA